LAILDWLQRALDEISAYCRFTSVRFRLILLNGCRHETCSSFHHESRSRSSEEAIEKFALDVLALLRTFPTAVESRSIGNQLIRSATGTAANYWAACRSRSDDEFIARIGVALEEADESALWLEIITEGRLSTAKEAFRLLDEADQLSAIFAQSRITSIEGTKQRKEGRKGTRVYFKRV
jgi:four helix bundle protein